MTKTLKAETKAFVTDMQAVADWHFHIAIRDPKQAVSLKVAVIDPITTHDYEAVMFDDMGNAFVLTSTGDRVKLPASHVL